MIFGIEQPKTIPNNPNMHDMEQQKPKNISASERDIYFYNGVDCDAAMQFNKELRTLHLNMRRNLLDFGNYQTSINIRIQSNGGSLFSGFSIADTIKELNKDTNLKVDTIVEGSACSAATIISMIGNKRFISHNSFMLIHQLSSWHWGNYEQLKDDMKNSVLFMKTIKDFYIAHCKIPKIKLKDILKRDIYFDAKQCLEYGMVDFII